MASEEVSFRQECSSLAGNKQLHGSEHGNVSHSQTAPGCLSGTMVGANKTIWVTQSLSWSQGRVLGEDRSRGSRHRESHTFPVLALGSLGPSTTLPTRASSPARCWPCVAEGNCPAHGKERSVCSELLYIALFALGEGFKTVGIYWPVLQTVCFINIGCFLLLGLLSWL